MCGIVLVTLETREFDLLSIDANADISFSQVLRLISGGLALQCDPVPRLVLHQARSLYHPTCSS